MTLKLIKKNEELALLYDLSIPCNCVGLCCNESIKFEFNDTSFYNKNNFF